MFSRTESLTFAAFDLVWLDGSLTAVPYAQRRAELEALAFHRSRLVPRPRWDTEDAIELFQACDDPGLEGMVVKRGRSVCRPGMRSNDWPKAKIAALGRAPGTARARPRSLTETPGACSPP
jgi:bifunctional non-homologous end joining protein LigD